MKITDLVKETKKINEAPLGMIKKAGLQVAKVAGSGKAAGQLDTGNIAGKLRKEFDIFLGKTGQEATGQLVLDFLINKGYPTTSADTIIKSIEPAVAIPDPAIQAAADTRQAKQSAAASSAQSQMAQLTPQKGEIRKGSDGVDYQWAGAQWINKATGAAAGKNPPALSTPVNAGLYDSVNPKGSKMFENYLRYFRVLKEALTAQQLDKIFLAAAQDQAKATSLPATEPTPAATDTMGSKITRAIASKSLTPTDAVTSTAVSDNILTGLNVDLIKAGLTGVVSGQTLAPQQIEEIKKLLANLG